MPVSAVYTQAKELAEQNSYRRLQEFLIEHRHKLNIDETDDTGATLLMHAARLGTPKCAQVFLEFGSLVDHTDRQHNSALHYAYRHRNAAVGTLLLRHGASEGLRNSSGRTAREVFPGDEYKVRTHAASTPAVPATTDRKHMLKHTHAHARTK